VVETNFSAHSLPEIEPPSVPQETEQQAPTKGSMFSRSRVALTIRTANPSRAIIGVMLAFTHSQQPRVPTSVRVQNRRYVFRE
jgi:hypothetical protein